MFKKKEFSKIYLASFFLLLIIISIFSAIIFEKTKKDHNQKIVTLNLETKVEEHLLRDLANCFLIAEHCDR